MGIAEDIVTQFNRIDIANADPQAILVATRALADMAPTVAPFAALGKLQTRMLDATVASDPGSLGFLLKAYGVLDGANVLNGSYWKGGTIVVPTGAKQPIPAYDTTRTTTLGDATGRRAWTTTPASGLIATLQSDPQPGWWTDATLVRARLWGGGGGAGAGTNNTTASASAGGGGGGYCEALIPWGQMKTAVCTVGAYGQKGGSPYVSDVTGTQIGSAGGNTSIVAADGTVLARALGGQPGINGTYGQVGGLGGGYLGTLAYLGYQGGQGGTVNSVTGNSGSPGAGGGGSAAGPWGNGFAGGQGYSAYQQGYGTGGAGGGTAQAGQLGTYAANSGGNAGKGGNGLALANINTLWQQYTYFATVLGGTGGAGGDGSSGAYPVAGGLGAGGGGGNGYNYLAANPGANGAAGGIFGGGGGGGNNTNSYQSGGAGGIGAGGGGGGYYYNQSSSYNYYYTVGGPGGGGMLLIDYWK